jgi:hypothetical protein
MTTEEPEFARPDARPDEPPVPPTPDTPEEDPYLEDESVLDEPAAPAGPEDA